MIMALLATVAGAPVAYAAAAKSASSSSFVVSPLANVGIQITKLQGEIENLFAILDPKEDSNLRALQMELSKISESLSNAEKMQTAFAELKASQPGGAVDKNQAIINNGANVLWQANLESICRSVQNAVMLVEGSFFASLRPGMQDTQVRAVLNGLMGLTEALNQANLKNIS